MWPGFGLLQGRPHTGKLSGYVKMTKTSTLLDNIVAKYTFGDSLEGTN